MNDIARINLTQRRWLLVLHLLFAAIMLGGAVAFLILSLVAASTSDEGVLRACYTAMQVLSESSVRASTIGTLVTGILLSVLTQWGLFKFYWIIAKEILTLVAIALGPIGMYLWTLKAVRMTDDAGLNALHDSAFLVNQNQMMVGIILQIVSLAAMFVLSVFKPWGQRKRRTSALASGS
ncbi:hypothetical protein [Cohnella sp. GCM10027633]|uniref:hypothetical protein n=1 Tax=unclassified Cohnella TaxID=2636738 RepID=UPI003639BC6D